MTALAAGAGLESGGVSRLLIALGLVVLAGLLAMVDSALSRVSPSRVEKMVREGRQKTERLGWIAADPPRYLNVLLLLRKASELSAMALVLLVVLRETGTSTGAALLVGLAMTGISYVFIGVAPRTLGMQHSEWVAHKASGPVHRLAGVLGPLPRILILLGNALTPGKGFPHGPFSSESELRDLVDLAEERRVIEEGERDMIHSVFELGDTLVREVMVPRPDVVAIERGKTVRQALTLALRSGFSRIPVYGESIDDIVGVAYLKDLVKRDRDRGSQRLEEVLRAAVFVPESKPVDELLREMQRAQVHMALVVDEYGGTAGIVTIEDVLEEIVGEIADEYDSGETPIEALDDGSLRVTSRLDVDELAERLGVDLPTEDADSVGGLMASALGRVPIPGATVVVAGLRLTAEGATGRRNRVGTVLVERVEEAVDA